MRLIFLFPLLFLGCYETKYVYIKPKYPKLVTYEYNKSITLTAYNKDNKICIKEWNSCIPKKEMIKLITYIKTLKTINKKYTKEINMYNQFVDKNLSK